MNTDILTTLGISEKAAKVYVTALSLGTASVQDLAQKAGLKRPTTYLHIDELLGQGLLHKVPIGKKEYYVAADPHIFEERATQKLKALQEAVPQLAQLRDSVRGKPSVTILEGEQGIKQIYDEIRKANSIRFWSSIATFESTFGDYFDKIATSINKQQIVTREIIDDTPASKKASKRYAEIAGNTYSSRIATISGIENDNAIYGNVAALFRIQGANCYVVRIEDPLIVNALKALFDMAWGSATPYQGK